MRTALLAMVLGGCGAPLARDVPHPDNGAMAGAAAAVAGAATLADPKAAGKNSESQQHAGDAPNDKGVKVKETVPAATFDRLEAQGSGSSAASAATPGPTKPCPTPCPTGIPSPAAAAAQANGDR